MRHVWSVGCRVVVKDATVLPRLLSAVPRQAAELRRRRRVRELSRLPVRRRRGGRGPAAGSDRGVPRVQPQRHGGCGAGRQLRHVRLPDLRVVRALAPRDGLLLPPPRAPADARRLVVAGRRRPGPRRRRGPGGGQVRGARRRAAVGVLPPVPPAAVPPLQRRARPRTPPDPPQRHGHRGAHDPAGQRRRRRGRPVVPREGSTSSSIFL